MCMFKIQYVIKDEGNILEHSRFYSATNESIAKEMFNETCKEGSLVGYKNPEVTKVIKLNVLKKTN